MVSVLWIKYIFLTFFVAIFLTKNAPIAPQNFPEDARGQCWGRIRIVDSQKDLKTNGMAPGYDSEGTKAEV